MDDKLMLLGEVSKLLDVKPHQIVYLFTSRKVADVPMLGNRRVFRPGDIRRVAKALGIEMSNTKQEERS